jgi:hypothetical protein
MLRSFCVKTLQFILWRTHQERACGNLHHLDVDVAGKQFDKERHRYTPPLKREFGVLVLSDRHSPG